MVFVIPLYDEIASADSIVIGSPVYMAYASGQTKTFLDRWYAFLNFDFSNKLPKGKKAALVFSQGQPNSEMWRQSFGILEGPFRLLGVDLKDTLVAAGFREAGAVAGDEALMQKARALGEGLAG